MFTKKVTANYIRGQISAAIQSKFGMSMYEFVTSPYFRDMKIKAKPNSVLVFMAKNGPVSMKTLGELFKKLGLGIVKEEKKVIYRYFIEETGAISKAQS